MCIYIYIYIYIERERVRDTHTCMYIYVYVQRGLSKNKFTPISNMADNTSCMWQQRVSWTYYRKQTLLWRGSKKGRHV